jgi:WD40 repeat protein
MALSPDGIKVATGESNGTSLLVWRLRDLAVVGQLQVPVPEGAAHACFSCADAVGPRLLAVCADPEHTVVVYDWQKYGTKAPYPGTPLASRAGDARAILAVACMPSADASNGDGDVWVTVGVRHLRFWRLIRTPSSGGKNKPSYTLTYTRGAWGSELGRETTLASVACVGNVTVAGAQDGSLYIIRDMTVVNVIPRAHAVDASGNASVLSVYAVNDASPSGMRMVATGGRDGKVKLWHLRDDIVEQSNDGQVLTPAMEIDVRKTAKLATNAAGLRTSIVNSDVTVTSGIRSIALIEHVSEKKDDGKSEQTGSMNMLLLAAMSTNEVLLIETGSEKVRLLLQGHFTPQKQYMAAHPTKPLFATTGSDRSVRVWTADQRCVLSVGVLTEAATCIAWAPREQLDHHITVGLPSGGIAVLVFRVSRADLHINTFPVNVAPGEPPPPPVTAVAYSPSSRCIKDRIYVDSLDMHGYLSYPSHVETCHLSSIACIFFKTNRNIFEQIHACTFLCFALYFCFQHACPSVTT